MGSSFSRCIKKRRGAHEAGAHAGQGSGPTQMLLQAEEKKVSEGLSAAPSGSTGPLDPRGTLHFGFRPDFHRFYNLGKEIGKGQFGTAFYATPTMQGRLMQSTQMIAPEPAPPGLGDPAAALPSPGSAPQCAVKIIRKKALSSREAIEDVQREVKVMRALNGHPNIVSLYDVFEDEKNIYLVLELCTGGELFEAVLQRGSFSERDAANLISQMLQMVAQCHLKGVIHRDIKPENLLFTHPGSMTLKLTDFGLSDFFTTPRQKFNDVVGSAFYVAPEVLRRNYGPAADIWSVGIIGYILLTGRPPFWAQTETGIFQEILRSQPDFEQDPWGHISTQAKDLIKSLLLKDPKARPSAAQALAHPYLYNLAALPQTPLDVHVLNNMRTYLQYDKLKRLFLRRVAESYVQSEDLLDLQLQFTALDKDGDGKITHAELLRAIRELRTGENRAMVIPEEQVPSILQAMDHDGSGEIDFIEFLTAALGTSQLEKRDKEGWRRHTREAFDRLDKDGNGRITLQEIVEDLGTADRELSSLLRRADKNGDGTIDFNEFLGVLRDQSSALLGPRSPPAVEKSQQSSFF